MEIVLDLGATWFRSAVVGPGGELQDVRRRAALGRRLEPSASARRLQQMLTEHVLQEVSTRREEHGGQDGVSVGISLGAAIDGRSGLVLGSAPLWGPCAPPFDLAGELRAAEPGVRWTVLNDVSAAALALAAMPLAASAKKLAAVTLSSGIALRTVEVATGKIATGPAHGLQGEIGHISVDLTLEGQRLSLPCDCGEKGHLASFLSGHGLPNALAAAGYATAAKDSVQALATALGTGDARTLAILDGLTLPLARILLDLTVLDPECERVVLYGGVARALGEPLRQSIVRNLDGLGLYGVSDRDPGFFDRMVRLVESDHLGLLGMARALSLQRPSAVSVTGDRRWNVAAVKHVRYEVSLTQHLLDPVNPALAAAVALRAASRRRVVVADRNVARIYGDSIRSYFAAHDLDLHLVELDAGESSKTVDQVIRLVHEFTAAQLPRRDTPIVAIGGGVVLDVAGLAASLFRRGTPYVRVPTTLLGLIDAGIGIKTAVNVGRHKSRIGTYHPSTVALLDLDFLPTLDRRELACGMAEAIKMALVKDGDLFELIALHAESVLSDPAGCAATEPIVRRAVAAMLEELAGNLWEDQLTRLADFGHSFSPAIEMHASPPLLHGEAVSIDMAISSLVARNRGLLSSEQAARILEVLSACGLPCWHEVCTVELLDEALAETTRHRGNRQRLPLPVGIGAATFVDDLELVELAAAVEDLAASATAGTTG